MRKSSERGNIQIIALFLSVVMFIGAAFLYLASRSRHETVNQGCKDCHIDEKPVKGKSDLRKTPANHPIFSLSKSIAQQGYPVGLGGSETAGSSKTLNPQGEPSEVIMNELVDKYGPVSFSHKTHADMAQMSGGCWSCHHNAPAGKPFPACKTCHKVMPDRKNPSMPRLEAAYHRQCIDCHKSWSRGNNCDVCHLKTSVYDPKTPPKRHYPKLEQPHRFAYKTKNKNTIVTFFHDNHVNLFKIPCENCHSKSTCSDCHDRQNKNSGNLPKQGHKLCSSCHDTKDKSSCGRCHKKEALTAFEHNEKAFPLKKYHAGLSCDACHHINKPFAKLNSDCRTCHKGLKFKSFKHSSTGFSLEKDHTGVPCAKCHPANRPTRLKSSSCVSCHEVDPSKFDHSTTGFSLKGYHKDVHCSTCHPLGKPKKKTNPDCKSCHPEMVIKGFNHASTGFAIKPYHKKVKCIECHTSGKDFYTAGLLCRDCHKKEFSSTFDHSTTKFPLKQYHINVPCLSCHKDAKYVLKSSDCVNCHKKGVSHKSVAGFELDALHMDISCKVCHNKGFENFPVNCLPCHKDKTFPRNVPEQRIAQPK